MSADSIEKIADLLPCPFCKKAPSHVECMDIGMLGIEHKYAVTCYCGAQGPEAVGQNPKRVERKAAKLWNRRALPSHAELERDAGRLDWLVSRGYWFGGSRDGELVWLMRLGGSEDELIIERVGESYYDAREAIDAARANEAQRQEVGR